VLAAGNDSVRLLFDQQIDDAVGVIAAVSQHIFTFNVKRPQDLVADDTIVDVAGRHFKSKGIAEGVYHRVNLGGQSSS